MSALQHVLLLLLLLAPTRSLAGTVRIGLFVGNNIGFGEDAPLEYAEKEARDFSRLFQDMGDLSKERAYTLQGASAGELQEQLRQVEAQSREIAARGDDAMVLFYYSGHASRDGLHMQGSLLPMDALRRWLEGSSARVRIALVDACESGSLARLRGGQPVEAIEITVDDTLTASGLAVIASTGPLSVARESASFGGGVFTRAMLTGLRGSADEDGDGVITLDESYRYAFAQTVLGTAAGTQPVQKPEFRYEIAGVGDVVLTRLPNRAAQLILPEELEGVYTVVSVANGQVVSRHDKKAGQARHIALPAGRYVVRKVRREDVLLAELDLGWGGARWIDDSQMTSVGLGDPLARGNWSLRPLRLSARGGANTPLYPGVPTMFGGELELQWLPRPALALLGFASAAAGQRYDDLGVLRTRTLRLGLGAMGVVHTRLADLSAGGGVEAAHFWQRVAVIDDIDPEEPDVLEVKRGSVFSPGLFAQGAVHFPLGPVFGLDVGIRAHLVIASVDASIRVLPQGEGLIGLSARFGGRQVGRAQRSR